MGQDASAILFYGVILDESSDESRAWCTYDEDADEEPVSEDDDWEKRYARITAGVTRPEIEFEDPGGAEAFRAYWSAIRDAAKPSPCEIGWHGYIDGAPPWHVAVKETVVCAADYGDTEVTVQTVPRPDLEQIVRDWCALMGIDIEGRKIGWHLAASFG